MKRTFLIKLAGGLFLTDLAVKREIEARPEFDREQELLSGRVGLKRLYNHGMAGSRFRGHMDEIAAGTGIVTFGSVAAFLALHLLKGRALQKWGMAFLTGGALSNLYERCKKGYVVDYIRFHTPWKRLNDLVFNLADFFILIGAGLICLGTTGRTRE